jgi:hypothetical protein
MEKLPSPKGKWQGGKALRREPDFPHGGITNINVSLLSVLQIDVRQAPPISGTGVPVAFE